MSGAAAGGVATAASLATSAARVGTGQKPRGAARLSGYFFGKGRCLFPSESPQEMKVFLWFWKGIYGHKSK